MDISHLHTDILNNLQTGVVVHGPDTHILFCNPRACELLGLSDDQMRGKTALDKAWQFVDDTGCVVPLADYPVNRVISSGRAVKDMVLGVNAGANAQTVWLLASAFPQHNADGQLTQVVVDFHDITKLRNAQKKQIAHEVFTTSVLDSLTEHIVVLDKEGCVVAVNQAWLQFVQGNGLPPAVLTPIGMNYLQDRHVSHGTLPGEEACAGIAAVLSGQQDRFQLEYPCHSPDRTHWFKMNVTRLEGDTGGAVVSHINITEQRHTELEAQHNMQLLMGSIEAIDEAFVIYDSDERLVFCNEKYRQLYPHLRDMIVPGTLFEDIIRAGAEIGFYPESLGNVESWVQERLAAFRSGIQTRIQRASNGQVLRAVERNMANGHTVGFRIDITELVNASDTALAASRAKSQFLANVSHEIRTPMNGILGMAQMLLQPNLNDSVRDHYARTILSSGQTLLTLLNDVLDLAKIEAGKFRLDSTVFSPEALMHETCNLFGGAALAKSLQLDHQWHGAPGQGYVGDSNRLRQMLSNLVGNAIKFTRSGRVHIEAQVIERTPETSVLEFSVSDTGIGIPADKLGLLFKPFSQTDNSTTREFGGSGLGLSIVINLAKAMEGDVGVSSEPGQGSRFWFRVTVAQAKDMPDSGKADQTPIESSAAEEVVTLAGHVLVAEDNPVNCMVIESLLTQLGLTVTLVHDGQQAVEAITQAATSPRTDQHQRPDLILMDLQMPVMDGYNATKTIRQWESAHQGAQLPIIALTADAFEEDRQHCIAVGMNDFLTKPISLHALQASLTRWLAVKPQDAAQPLP